MSEPQGTERKYWLWVTRPEYYLDDEGMDREDLDPSIESAPGDWWTCHKDTMRGDLILMYRTTPKRDLGYLIQAESDAYSLTDDDHAWDQGWDFGCDFRVLYKFPDPVTLADLRMDPGLDDWGPLRAKFRRKVFSVAPGEWDKLTELAAKKNPEFADFIGYVIEHPVVPNIKREEELEDFLVENLALLQPFGYDLELYEDPSTGVPGRQLVCKGGGGRIDLLCIDRSNEQYVVIELKNVRASPSAFAQVCGYVGWVEERISSGQPVVGLVISRGSDPKFRSACRVTDCIRQIDLAELGLE